MELNHADAGSRGVLWAKMFEDSKHNRTESTSSKSNPYQILSRVYQNLLNNSFTEHLPDHKTQQDYKKSTTVDKQRFVKTLVTNPLCQRLETFFSDPPIVYLY